MVGKYIILTPSTRRFIAALLTVLVTSYALAGTTGMLEGRVTDKTSGEPLIGVNILIMGTSFGGATDTEGKYLINNIRAGVHDVRFSMVGYATVVMQRVTILPDLKTRIDVELSQAAIEMDVVEIRAERPLIQKDLAGTAFSISEAKIERLPISSFSEVLSLQPGTTLEGNVRGGRTTEVMYLIDGVPAQDVITGGLGTNLPRSSITGLTVHTGGFDAEYGNAMSGVVNVITKGGSDLHNLSLRYERDGWLPERWHRQQDRFSEFELSAGGPIARRKLFYFTATNVTVTDTRWWQDFSRFFQPPVSQEISGFGKLEYHLNPTFRVSTQGLYSMREWHDYEFSWRFNLDGLPSRSRDALRFSTNVSHTLTQHSYYTFSGSVFYMRSRINVAAKEALSLLPHEYDFFLRYVVNGDRNWWSDTKQTIYTVKGDFTQHFSTVHLVKVGFEFNQYDIFSDLVKYEPQLTYFGKPLVDAPLLNYSNSYSYRPRTGSVFLQDKIQIVEEGSNVSLGVRWDFFDPRAERPVVEFIPVRPNEFTQVVGGTVRARLKHQFSPRISLAAPVGPSSFFFANFGHYFQFPLFDYLYSGINPATLRSGAKNVSAGNPDLEPERTVSWEVGFKHGVSEDVVVSATYFRKAIRNQIDSKTLVPFDSKYSGDYGFGSYVNNAEANASGVEFVLHREQHERLTGSLSYTYMMTEGVSEYVGQRINYEQWGFPLASQTFPLSWDQRHTVKLDADFRLAGDINANLIVLYNSARPYTYFPTRDGFSPLDTTKVLVPNNRRMDEFITINLKLTRRFPLDPSSKSAIVLYADVRNLLNMKNVKWMDSSGRIGGELGDPGAYHDPRRVRVGLRFEI